MYLSINASLIERYIRFREKSNILSRLILKLNFGIELFSQEVSPQVFSSIYNVSQLSSRWISVVPLSTLKTPKQKSIDFNQKFWLKSNLYFWFPKIEFLFEFVDNFKKIQVFGLLVDLSSSITRFTLNPYQTVSLTVTLFTYVMRILILRWASHLDAFSGYPLQT